MTNSFSPYFLNLTFTDNQSTNPYVTFDGYAGISAEYIINYPRKLFVDLSFIFGVYKLAGAIILS